MENLPKLYGQTEELFRMGEEFKGEPLLHYGMMAGRKQDMQVLVDFTVAGQTRDYAELLQSLQVTFLRMRRRGMSLEEKKERMDWMLRFLYGESLQEEEGCLEDESGQSLMVAAARQIWGHSEQGGQEGGGGALKEDRRYLQALEEIYRHFQDQKLSLHYLATEILYANEDYFGRFFQKASGKKFTKFLLDARIDAAEQLMRLEPDIMVYEVSEMTGYAADGQYFSKIFKKSTGMTPREYRERILRISEESSSGASSDN